MGGGVVSQNAAVSPTHTCRAVMKLSCAEAANHNILFLKGSPVLLPSPVLRPARSIDRAREQGVQAGCMASGVSMETP